MQNTIQMEVLQVYRGQGDWIFFEVKYPKAQSVQFVIQEQDMTDELREVANKLGVKVRIENERK